MSSQFEKDYESVSNIAEGAARGVLLYGLLILGMVFFDTAFHDPITTDANNAKSYQIATEVLVRQNDSAMWSFNEEKSDWIAYYCQPVNYEQLGKPFGESCDITTVNNYDYLNVRYDVSGIQSRIEKRNESFRQWRWFGKDPITMPSYQ